MAKSPKKTKPRRPPFPDVATWLPRTRAAESLSESFRTRCLFAEQRLQVRAYQEKRANLDNFDSGVGIEEIFREELSELLPRRYQVTNGILVDRRGYTAGHCDIVVFNDLWFPSLKSPAAEGSRRQHLPIEGVYSVIEVKQSLNRRSLEDAMEKLVVCHRLFRPRISKDRATENREGGSCVHFSSNPLYSAIVATGVATGADFERLVAHFVEISRLLRRDEMIRSLLVLGHGFVTWGFEDETGVRPARFSDADQVLPIFPALTRHSAMMPALYPFIQNLSMSLYHSVLGAEDLVAHYGYRASEAPSIEAPSDGWRILPDPATLAFFDQPCLHEIGG